MRCTPIILAAGFTLIAFSFTGCKSSISTLKGGGLTAQAPPPLEAVAIEPPPGLAEVGPLSVIRVMFSAEIDSASLGAAPLVVTDLVSRDAVAGGSTVEGNGLDLVFKAKGGLRPDAMYSVDVSRSLRSKQGGSFAIGTDPSSPRLPSFYSTFTSPPALQGGLTLVEATSSSLRLAWNAATDNASADGSAIVYDIYLAKAPAPIEFSVTPEKQTLPGVTTDVLTHLDPGVEYRVALRAVDSLGNLSTPSNEILATTVAAVDHEPPVFAGITRLEADPALPHVLKAVWSPGEDRPDRAVPVLYNVYLALESGKQDFRTPTKTSPVGATELEIDGLVSDTEYFVVVRAMDPSGNEETNTVEAPAPRSTQVSFSEDVFKMLTLPAGYDASLCWPACTNPVQPGGCARARCHTANNPQGGYNLTTYTGFLETGPRGPRVVAGQPDRSLLVLRMRSTTASRMPQGGTCGLFPGCIDAIARWVLQGALDN